MTRVSIPGALLDLVLERDADPAEARVAEGVSGGALQRVQRAFARGGALGDDHDREGAPALVTAAQVGAHLLDVERALGHEDRVGAARDPGVRGDPAGVAAHHLDDHHAVVGLRRGVQAVDRVGDDLHSGVEAERDVGAAEVVVDRLRHPDDRDALFVQQQRHAERVLAADRDQRADAAALQRRADRLEAAHAVGERIGARGAEDRAAAGEDANGALQVELDRLILQHPRPAVAEAEEAVLAARKAAAHGGADHGVQPGAIPAAGEQTNARHRHRLGCSLDAGRDITMILNVALLGASCALNPVLLAVVLLTLAALGLYLVIKGIAVLA